MDVMKYLFGQIYYVFTYELNILGYRFSLFSILIYTLIATVLIATLKAFFD